MRFEQLVGELHLAAMQVAVVTSGMNALSDGVRLKNPLALQDLGPQLPSADKISLPRHCREELGIAFKSHCNRARFLRRAARRPRATWSISVPTPTSSEPKRRAFLDLPAVADSWRCLSLRALTAVVALEKDVARCLPGRYSHNTPLLKKLLRSVIEGGRPCVDDNATVKLPDLPQRRAAVRPNVHLPCVLEYHGRTFQAVAKDISTGGVGWRRRPPGTADRGAGGVRKRTLHCRPGGVEQGRPCRREVRCAAEAEPSAAGFTHSVDGHAFSVQAAVSLASTASDTSKLE